MASTDQDEPGDYDELDRCWTCDGDGCVWGGDLAQRDPEGWQMTTDERRRMWPCDNCGGTGLSKDMKWS